MKEQRPIHVLIADDETSIRLTLEALLQRRGYRVTLVANGTEALAAVCAQPFDLLLLDLKMPGLSGIEVARQARSVQPHAAVLLFTGHGALEYGPGQVQLEGFAYVPKTISPQELLDHIASLLR